MHQKLLLYPKTRIKVAYPICNHNLLESNAFSKKKNNISEVHKKNYI